MVEYRDLRRSIRRGIRHRYEKVRGDIQERIERPEAYSERKRAERVKELEAENRELRARAERVRLQRQIRTPPRAPDGRFLGRASSSARRAAPERGAPRPPSPFVERQRPGLPDVINYRYW